MTPAHRLVLLAALLTETFLATKSANIPDGFYECQPWREILPNSSYHDRLPVAAVDAKYYTSFSSVWHFRYFAPIVNINGTLGSLVRKNIIPFPFPGER